jgi:molybdate transport system regulatory protein
MNKLEGKTIEIIEDNGLLQVAVDLGKSTTLRCLVLGKPSTASYLNLGSKLHVIFKETEVILGKGDELQLSLRNRIPGKIQKVKEGKLLCEVSLETEVGAVIAIVDREAFGEMELKTGDAVTVMIKQNEIMLSE